MTITAEATQRRAEIVRSAARLFDEKGYHNTGMDDIAEAVGLRKPTLYHYVKSKVEILVWIHNDVMTDVFPRLEGYVDEGLDPRETLRRVAADILEIMDTRPGYLRVFFEHHREIPEPLRTEAVRSRDRYQWLVESTIKEGIRQGIFREVRVRPATLALFGITNWSYQWYQPGGNYRELADELLDFYLKGLEPR
ncbi:TetR/AcrR family transcriptional regulator [Streptomyces sp. NBC_00035]|uniref:TetR/AcrR family transcriptional regulator n=1 Tax=Streptomyces sp. NBC_00035 TaxID=2903614 RepID=UPI00324F87F8